MATRADIVAEARTWLGTPWMHQQSHKGLAVDCGQLVLAVGKACGLVPADLVVNGYGRQPDGSLVDLCERELVRIPQAAAQPGDVILISVDRDPQHLGILGDYRHGGLSVIHAFSEARPPRVVETRLMWARNFRFVNAYAFRGVSE